VPASRKVALVRALNACARDSHKPDSRRFLQGLATNELQYIAEFLGSCILETQEPCCCTRAQLAQAIKQFERTRHKGILKQGCVQDQEHKMILLLEYLCRSGLTQFSIGVGAGQS
jgi:hypothetical protein